MGVEDDIEAIGKELVHKKKKKLEVRTEDVVVKAATYILKKLTNSNKVMFLLLKRYGNVRERIF